jgi:hypothetical protein
MPARKGDPAHLHFVWDDGARADSGEARGTVGTPDAPADLEAYLTFLDEVKPSDDQGPPSAPIDKQFRLD